MHRPAALQYITSQQYRQHVCKAPCGGKYALCGKNISLQYSSYYNVQTVQIHAFTVSWWYRNEVTVDHWSPRLLQYLGSFLDIVLSSVLSETMATTEVASCSYVKKNESLCLYHFFRFCLTVRPWWCWNSALYGLFLNKCIKHKSWMCHFISRRSVISFQWHLLFLEFQKSSIECIF